MDASIHTPASNLCGHGFYQFSPELFYRALNATNGFEVERMIMRDRTGVGMKSATRKPSANGWK